MDIIKIDGHIYGPEGVREFIKGEEFRRLPVWKQKIFRFLDLWWDESETITQYTSGSTGTPKAIELTKKAMTASARRTCRFFCITDFSRIGLCLSTDYIAGKMMVVRALFAKAELITAPPEGHPYRDFTGILDFVAMVPLQAENMLKAGTAVAMYRTILLGGADISPELEESIAEQETAYYLGYGMTETCSHVALRRLGVQEEDSQELQEPRYEAMPDVELAIDGRGCLVINDLATNSAPLSTNDIAELGDGFFVWKGRFDNVINSGGIKYSPEELEQKISPLFESAFLISSIADKRLGNKIILIIEDENLVQGSHVLVAKEKKQFLKELRPFLSKYALPYEVVMVPEIARTANGKVNRQVRYWA